ncbi:MAG: 4-(cytidine 5'-diphospho)-2-C-methyl-D-erythritol kinase [Defluviitaleaceae bacterium]|nr:4-(cytidine 5'-diphospho)-2-C-methyl-D-erythritol kinase [Defluviitaleaceae bacterium]
MYSVKIKAYAKINLSLDILGKREDGYHELSTVMQQISLHDELHFKIVDKLGYDLKLASDKHWLPTDSKNLVYQAARYLKDKFAINEGVFINIIKRIPVSAGLGGGSTDCAAAMFGMKKLFNLPLTDADIIKLGVKFGADVPFCAMGGAALATGIGEILRPMPSMPPCHIVLVKPRAIMPTEEAFRAFRQENVKTRPDSERLLDGLGTGNLVEICKSMANVLESVTVARFPVVQELKEHLLERGAMGAIMSGSGPSVFGIFDNHQTAKAAFDSVITAFPDKSEVFLVRPM